MSIVVLDTDAASLLHRQQLPPDHARHLVGSTLAITFVTIGELHKGRHCALGVSVAEPIS